MKTSEQLDLLAAALVKAQAAIKTAKKDTDNPFFKSKYADLSAVQEACKKPLIDNGLSVVQGFEAVDGNGLFKIRLVTRLLHTSGQWIESTLDIMPVDNKPQSVGSAITYGRRYALSALVGVVSDLDDDGNAASGNVGMPQGKPSYTPNAGFKPK